VHTIPDVLGRAASTWPDATAVVGDDGTAWTFAELADRVHTAARTLAADGVVPGTRVALRGANSPQWIVANLAVLAAGGAVLPLNHRSRDAEVAEVLARAACTLVLEDGVIAASARNDVTPRAPGPDDVSHLQFTSGTTGLPKGVLLTHGGMVATTRAWVEIVGLRPGDRYPVVNPFSHIGGHKTGLLAALVAGATVYPVARFDAPALADLITREAITFLQGPPAMFQALLDAVDARADPPPTTVRVAVTGSANIPPALVVRMKETLRLDAVHAGYGLTEATGVCTITRADDSLELVTRTSGRAIPGVEVRLRDAHAPGDEGEILVRGPGVMRGYLDDPAATAEAVDADGWLATGDVGALDADGNLEIRDRLKDLVIVGGFNAYPAEIERVLAEHEGVLQAAVVGVPDERLGEVPVAFVVRARRDPPTDAQLIEHVRGRLATYKVPRAVFFVDELPVNAIPKVDKVALANAARDLMNPMKPNPTTPMEPTTPITPSRAD
jgi:acyl-CoA synthetase (AMP-forming)/AMP-acid ligase II